MADGDDLGQDGEKAGPGEIADGDVCTCCQTDAALAAGTLPVTTTPSPAKAAAAMKVPASIRSAMIRCEAGRSADTPWTSRAVYRDFLAGVAELGLGSWFQPSITIWRQGDAQVTLQGGVIRPGYMLHCDFGVVYLGFSTDTQHNAYVLRDGETLALYHKHLLPNYSVFDEKRYFNAGTRPAVFELGGVQVGLTVCEDIWGPAPMAQAVRTGAQLVVNINASPFHVDKQAER